MTREKILTRLKGKISDKRLEHSIGVEYTAASLAFVYGVDIEKARTAGLLHDLAKGIPAKEKLEKARKHGIPVNKIEEKNPDMLHAKLGAYYAKRKYDIDDEEILSAIECHTTGKPDMSMLDKIIFVADYIEPNRNYIKELDIIRAEAFSDIDKCIVHILKNTLAYLDEKGGEIDYMSQMTYNYYVRNS